jgi:hypothetical protein
MIRNRIRVVKRHPGGRLVSGNFCLRSASRQEQRSLFAMARSTRQRGTADPVRSCTRRPCPWARVSPPPPRPAKPPLVPESTAPHPRPSPRPYRCDVGQGSSFRALNPFGRQMGFPSEMGASR